MKPRQSIPYRVQVQASSVLSRTVLSRVATWAITRGLVRRDREDGMLSAAQHDSDNCDDDSEVLEVEKERKKMRERAQLT